MNQTKCGKMLNQNYKKERCKDHLSTSQGTKTLGKEKENRLENQETFHGGQASS